jgi:hypothetical protein
MHATRALIQIFLPRVALRRRRARSVAAPATLVPPIRPEARLSPTCECPELRSSARTLRDLEPTVVRTSAASSDSDESSELVILLPSAGRFEMVVNPIEEMA